jgi:uncharacterized protein YdhG (YjbR/CyaY superfamily)
MKNNDVRTVDEYIASQSKVAQGALDLVRRAIRAAAPQAEELISYKMPAYTLNGADLVHFAGWKAHVSLYLASASIVEAFHDELTSYSVKKGTVSFPLAKPVPVKLIERIVKFRVKQIATR